MPDQAAPYEFEGFLNPNTTPVPDVVFDELLHILDNAELRVLLYIIRRTYGFKKSSDDISTGQMVDGIVKRDGTVLDKGTGLARTSVKRAIRGLLEKRIIIRRHNQADDGGNEPNTYALRYEKDSSNEAKTPGSANGPIPLVSPADPPLGPPADPTRNSYTTNSSSKIRTAAQDELLDTEGDSSSAALDSGEAPAAVRPTRGGKPKGIAELLNDYQPKFKVTTITDRDAQLEIASHIEAIAPVFGDKAPVKSSATRAYNLYRQSGLALPVFVSQLLTVRASVTDIASRRRIKNRMSYFFSLLEDNLGLTSEEMLAS